jgi:DNA polymerase
MTTLWIDLETYSEVPISQGTHRYAASAEIMLCAWAIDDGAVQVEDLTDYDKELMLPEALKAAMFDPAVTVIAHNSQFDRTVIRHAWGTDVPVTRWQDTMVQAMAHGLPGGLGDLCDILKIDQDKAKDKDGRALILLFCKPRPETAKIRRATRETHPAEWAKFVAYASLDIHAMRAVHKKLPTWNFKGTELALWHLDQQINDRGVAVDLDLANAAIAAVAVAQAELGARTSELTFGYVESTTQRDALLKHMLAAYGVGLPDLQMATLERRMNDPDLPAELRELMAIRLQASTTSTSKYKTLVNGTSADGRLRGLLQFCGASRTGRWAGRLFQPQNLVRPTMPNAEIECGIEALKAGCAGLIYG